VRGRTRRRALRAFTLLELMVVVAVFAILATLALPSWQGRIIAAQVNEGIAFARFAQSAVQAKYSGLATLPADNAAAGLPPAERIVGTYVTALAVHDGAIVITFGNQAHRSLAGKKLSLRAATVDDYPQVPISWVCGAADPPATMTLHVGNETTVPDNLLPLSCRHPAAAH
jgi:type IV pilus assembly protein PilA